MQTHIDTNRHTQADRHTADHYPMSGACFTGKSNFTGSGHFSGERTKNGHGLVMVHFPN